MVKIKKWFKQNNRARLIITSLSGIFLLFSIIKPINGLIPVDFAWGAIILSGVPIIYRTIRQLVIKHKIKSSLLVTIALIACIATGEYFAAGEVAFIMVLGGLLEDFTVRRSRAGLEKLLNLKPDMARISRDGKYVKVPSEEVVTGDTIMILAGESVPVDGVVVKGSSTVDQSVITGESVPKEKGIGDEVFSGTTNMHGNMTIRATSVGEDSSISRIIALVKKAEENKAPVLRIMDKWATYLVVAALTLSILIGLLTKDIMRAVTVLVVFCPCALVLAAPTAIASGIGNATRHGIIIKSGEALEKLGHVKRIAFDKTGTLTIGKPVVQNILITDPSLSRDEFYKFAASAEMYSEHPYGIAILEDARKKNVDLKEPESFKTISGKGIQAKIEGKDVLAGNPLFIREYGINIDSDLEQEIKKERLLGRTVIIISIDKKPAGIITLADRLRRDSKKVIKRMKQMGMKVTLLTGDNRDVAEQIAKEIDIDDIRFELLPEEKVEVVRQYEKTGEKLCMVGDGINDAPALKTAYTGIAMAGIGSDIACECSDVVLVKDDLSKLPYIIRLSRMVIKKINQNIIISMIINFAAIILAGFGILNPLSGAIVHNIGSVFVVANAALLLRRNIDKNNV